MKASSLSDFARPSGSAKSDRLLEQFKKCRGRDPSVATRAKRVDSRTLRAPPAWRRWLQILLDCSDMGIPDDLYRRVKARTAMEDLTVREFRAIKAAGTDYGPFTAMMR